VSTLLSGSDRGRRRTALGQLEKDRHRRHTAGKPPTAEMFTYTPALCQQRQSRDLLDHTYERARITRSRPLPNHLWLGYSSDML